MCHKGFLKKCEFERESESKRKRRTLITIKLFLLPVSPHSNLTLALKKKRMCHKGFLKKCEFERESESKRKRRTFTHSPFSFGRETGFEPATSGTTIQRSNQLSYNLHNAIPFGLAGANIRDLSHFKSGSKLFGQLLFKKENIFLMNSLLHHGEFFTKIGLRFASCFTCHLKPTK